MNLLITLKPIAASGSEAIATTAATRYGSEYQNPVMTLFNKPLEVAPK